MARNHNGFRTDDKVLVHFHLLGLIVFGGVLLLAGGIIGYLVSVESKPAGPPPVALVKPAAEPGEVPPWGELAATDIALEPPDEFLVADLRSLKPPEWQFQGMSAGQVDALMTSCGLVREQIVRALSPALMTDTASNIVVRPDDALILSLAPVVRQKFYSELSHLPGNAAKGHPYIYPLASVETCLRDTQLNAGTVALIRKLIYPQGQVQCFGDVNTVAQHLESREEKMQLLRVLSRQTAVIARLQLWPGTDVNRLVEYWGRGAKSGELRSLLRSMTRIPEGSSLSLLYLLPQFARQRVCTFPAPAPPGSPAMDCHWSTVNFFLDAPDNRYSDSNEAVAYIKGNCHSVPAATRYGDIVVFLDGQSRAVHSAVYLADDLVFTKNGNNFAQPWKLSRLQSLRARYEVDGPLQLSVWRMNNS